MDFSLVVSAEVEQSLVLGQPVVALESTVITHGLAYPQNLQTAQMMENAVRAEGCVPATIGVIAGEVIVGLSAKQLALLAQLPRDQVRKCSRRDLPIVIAQRLNAGTTVAGTMIIAHLAGIELFATGGIGGVHRGAPFDVSADLLELGRTPVTVVCSGVKSILDMPATREVLETQGVTVVGYQVLEMPAFYSRQSGLMSDVCANSPDDVAQIIRARQALKLTSGTLVAVPVPVEAELSAGIVETAIKQATAEAAIQNIVGSHATPWLLARVAELTNGTSVQANVALLTNNCKIASRIARQLTVKLS